MTISIEHGDGPYPVPAEMFSFMAEDQGLDLSGVDAGSEEQQPEFAGLSVSLEDVLSTEDGEEFVTLPEPEEEQAFAPVAADNTVDTTALDVQPVVDPLDDLLDQNNLYI